MKTQVMKTLVSSILIATSILTLNSCTERVDIKLDSTFTRLIVEGTITTDTTAHCVRLSKSADYFYNSPTPSVSNAVITISDGDTSWVLTEDPTKPGYYYTDSLVYGIQGKTYKLLIENIDINDDDEKEVYEATSYLPLVAPIDSIELIYRMYPFGSVWDVNMFALDPPSREYYLFKIYINDTMISDTLSEVSSTDDAFFNGNYSNGINVQILVEDRANEKLFPGDKVTLELNSISEEYFKFFIAMQSSTGFSTPLFSGPPANPPTNLSNGALGFFTAFSVSRNSKIVPPQPWVPEPF